MDSFELFFERCQPPVEVLSKYKDDPNVFISFTNIIQPRALQEPEGSVRVDKNTSRLGLNPLTSYDTPAGIYSYPLKVYWDTIKEYSHIPYVKDMPYVWIFKPRDPDKCARTSTYTNEDLTRDLEELHEIFPSYNVKQLHGEIDSYYSNNPLQEFWSTTRSLASEILPNINANRPRNKHTKHIAIWTHIMRRFYDGIIDDTGSSTIHSNEPWQAVFWTSAQITPIDRIDRTCGGKNSELSRAEWSGENKNNNFVGILNKPSLMKSIISSVNNNNVDGVKSNIKKLMVDSGLYHIIKTASKGDPNGIVNSSEYKLDGLNTSYIDLILDLYFDNRHSDEKIFFDENVSMVSASDKFIRDNFDTISRLTGNNSLMVADKILSKFLAPSYYGRLPDYQHQPQSLEKLFIILSNNNSSGRYWTYVNRYISNNTYSNIKKIPRLLSLFSKDAEKLLSDSNSYFPSSTTNAIVELFKILESLNVYSAKVWKRLFWVFTSYEFTTYDKEKCLNAFLKANTGIEQDLKDFINKNNSSPNETLDDIWYRHFGTSLFAESPSQADSIRKSRHIKPTPPKFEKGDIVVCPWRDYAVGMVMGSTQNGGNQYEVEYESGLTAFEHEEDLKEYSNKPKNTPTPFKYNDKVEDSDGNIYRVSNITNDKVVVIDGDWNSKVMDVNDLVKYDPETSLNAAKLPEDVMTTEAPQFKKGDVILITNKLADEHSKYHIIDVDLSNKKYVYNVYRNHAADPNSEYTLFVSGFIYDIKKFEYSLKDDIIVSVTHGDVSDTTPTYVAGDTFFSIPEKTKTVVISYNKDKDTYHVKYYGKYSDGSWNVFLNDESVNRKLFDNYIKKYTDLGTLHQDVKI